MRGDDLMFAGELWISVNAWSRCVTAIHTIVIPHLQLRKVIAQHAIVCVVAVVIGRPSLLSRLADAVHLIRLRRAIVLSS